MRARKLSMYEVSATIARSRPHRINLYIPKEETAAVYKITDDKKKCIVTKFVIFILRVAKLSTRGAKLIIR